MQKFAYRSPDDFRPEQNLNIRESAAKPYMGLTAFLRFNEPWLVMGFDGKSHTLTSREGNTIKLSTPFDWIEATDKSRLVAALCSEGCQIPGTPHYSFEDKDWYFRIDNDIYDGEEILRELSRTSGVTESEGYIESPIEIPGLEGPFKFPSGWIGYYDPAQGAYYDRGSDMYMPRDFDPASQAVSNFTGISHQVQEGESRPDEKTPVPICPQCKSHTRGNKIAEFDKEGNALFHCKSCGHTYKAQGIINPKLTYQVDNEGKGNYTPGPDDPNKVASCPNCGYSWKAHHKFQAGDKTCPECHHEFKHNTQEDVQAAEGRSSRVADFTYDSLSGKDTGAVNSENLLQGRNTDAVSWSGNNEQGAAPLDIPQFVEGPNGEILALRTPEGLNTDPEVIKRATSSETKTSARKAFSPHEQKALIDESTGQVARNSSKLNLEGTHYVSRERDENPELWLW